MRDYMNILNLERPPPNAMWIYLWSIQRNVSFAQFHFKNAIETKKLDTWFPNSKIIFEKSPNFKWRSNR